MAEALVAVSTPADGVRVLAFNRPQKRNALSQELIDVFCRELGAAELDDEVRVVLVTGSKTFFCGKCSVQLMRPWLPVADARRH